MLLMRPTYHRLPAVFRRAAILASLTALCVASLAQASSLVITGAGDGHGVGMSQEGALGYAERGWSYEAILSHYYSGTRIGQAPPNTRVSVLLNGGVKRISLEAYVRGVVAAEVPASWPMAALQAQAVASRTYAITAHAGGAKFDVYADTRSQVYLGKAAETSRTNTAVATTAGQIVTYAGQAAITYFFASSGGHTESVQNSFVGSTAMPWLVGVADPYDAGARHGWTVTMSFATVASRLSGLVDGSFKGIEVRERGSSPRIVTAYVLASKGRTLVSGPELASRLGLHDTWAYFSVSDSHGTHSEPDLSGSAPPTPPDVQPNAPLAGATRVSGSGGSAAAVEATPSPATTQPTAVNGEGGTAYR
jgi:stage II sporulation protein D